MFFHLAGLVDLEDSAQDFVLETKQIAVPGYPDAFNPSITPWRGSYLMSFRTRNPLTKRADQFGLILLDKNFMPAGQPQLLEIPFNNTYSVPWTSTQETILQDPRLIAIGYALIWYTTSG